jgi:Do/DeqQ family serine protease
VFPKTEGGCDAPSQILSRGAPQPRCPRRRRFLIPLRFISKLGKRRFSGFRVPVFMRRTLFVILIVALLAFGWWRYHSLTGGTRRVTEHYTPADGPRLDPKSLQVLSALDAEYTRLVDAVVPSVVSVNSRSFRVANPGISDPLAALFGLRRRGPQTSLGSGVIISKEGHILTNHHVIKGMDEIVVRLTDGRQEAATFIGSDPTTDIAVLKINASNITPLALGDSDAVRVGQVVFAVGNPFGLEETVTQGIISAKGRRAINDMSVECLQTDAAVNQGNSGGPLLNLRGEIIGINTAIFSKTGGNIGISFAVPSNAARQTLESVLKTGRAVRGYLGVILQEITPQLARQYGIRDLQGVLVLDVAPGSPAEAAGLQPGDILRKVDGRPVTGLLDVGTRVSGLPLQAKVEIIYERNGRPISTTATIAEAPRSPLVPAEPGR